MNGQSCGEESMTIMFSRFDTIPACDGRTDGRTDRQTVVQPISITCFSIADARKKQIINRCFSFIVNGAYLDYKLMNPNILVM